MLSFTSQSGKGQRVAIAIETVTQNLRLQRALIPSREADIQPMTPGAVVVTDLRLTYRTTHDNCLIGT